MSKAPSDNQYFGTEKTMKILFKLAPPVMLAQLIQSLYNIVDSFFIGKFSGYALTALSVIYPMQLLICAVAVGTGVGVNTVMARFYGQKRTSKAINTAGIGTVMAVVSWFIFALISFFIIKPYALISAESEIVHEYTITYGRIIGIFSLGIFLESTWTKILQSQGDMKTPMIAQIVGALTNIVLDPILIFGMFGIKPMGVAGAAIATVIGQSLAAVITGIKGFYKPPKLNIFLPYVKQIYAAGLPNIIMQALWTVYILGLNVLLASFSDASVTVLGIYYKLQSFFFIPLNALGVCIVPVLSFNYAINRIDRCKRVFWETVAASAAFMLLGVAIFVLLPKQSIGIFSNDTEVLNIGNVAFRIIGASFVPAALSLTFPILFQAIGKGKESIFITMLRQVVLLVPLAWVFSFAGLNYVWLTFPVTEIITCSVSMIFYKKVFHKNA